MKYYFARLGIFSNFEEWELGPGDKRFESQGEMDGLSIHHQLAFAAIPNPILFVPDRSGLHQQISF